MNAPKKNNGHLAKKLEMNEIIEKLLRMSEGNPVPISRIVFIVNSRLGFSERSVRERLEMLEENGHIKFLPGQMIAENNVSLKDPFPEEERKISPGW